LQTFTTTFNGLVNEISTLTQWNSTTDQAGLLLGDSTVQDLQSQLYTAFNSVVSGGQYKLLSDVGFTVNGDGTISFNQDTFNAAYAANPTAVENLFTQAGTGIGTIIDKSLGEVAAPVTGTIALQESTLTNQVQGFNTQITNLNTLLDDQRNTLEAQFANMEVVLAGLQSQGSALASIGTIGASVAKTSSSSGSGSSGSSSSDSGSSSSGTSSS
jgi:flagellar hook-associated protein 2